MFPHDWKISRVTPVHKNGPFNDMNNYRPISVVTIIAKIITLTTNENGYWDTTGIHPRPISFFNCMLMICHANSLLNAKCNMFADDTQIEVSSNNVNLIPNSLNEINVVCCVGRV